MKFLQQLSAISMLALTLAGCAATGPKFADFKTSIAPLADDKGRVFFYRPGKFLGAAIRPSVKLNGNVVGESTPGGFFYVDVPEGDYEVSVSTEVEKKLTFVVKKQTEKCVRLSIGLGVVAGRVYPELAEKSMCDEEIKDMSYIGTGGK